MWTDVLTHSTTESAKFIDRFLDLFLINLFIFQMEAVGQFIIAKLLFKLYCTSAIFSYKAPIILIYLFIYLFLNTKRKMFTLNNALPGV